ncbi:MAG: PAS-domain containing protein, partial [Lacipirellulaceae bacterium]
MAQGLIVFDEYSVRHANKRAAELLELPSDLLSPGLSLDLFLRFQHERGDFGSGENGGDAFAKIRRRIARGQDFEGECRLPRGRIVWASSRARESGGFVVTYTDVTELRQALQESSQSSRLLREAADAMAQGMVIFGPRKIEFASAKAAALLDLPAEYLEAGRDWNDYFEFLFERGDYGTGQQAREKIDRLKNEIANSIGHRVERLSTTGRNLLIEGEPRPGGGLVVTVSDVTDSKRLQSEVKLSKQRFESIAEINSDWFWEMDADLRFVYFSDSLLEATGIDPRKLIGKRREEAVLPEVDEEVFRQHLETLRDRKPFRDFVYSRLRGDERVWLSISGNPVFDSDGQFCGYIGSGRNVSEAVVREGGLNDSLARNPQKKDLVSGTID